jgi:hypothetical protein
MPPPWKILTFTFIVERCLQKDNQAWDELWHLTNPLFAKRVRLRLAHLGIRDEFRVEETVEDVWSRLAEPGPASLQTYVEREAARELATDEHSLVGFEMERARCLLRDRSESEDARHRRERAVAARRPEAHAREVGLDQLEAAVYELLQHLTPRQRDAIWARCCADPDFRESLDLSDANKRKINSRARTTIMEMLKEGPLGDYLY